MIDGWVLDAVSIGLVALILVIVVTALIQRIRSGKGVGWQFIRFTVISMSLPICALLALNNALTGEASTILAAALAYAFGKDSSGANTET